jgi:thiamine biosynthesis lipoprotein
VRYLFLIPFFALAACGGHGQVELVGSTMGTQFSVKLPNGVGDHDALKLQKAVEAVLENVDETMSTYRPESMLSQFNSNPSVDWQRVERDFCLVVENSLEISQRTDGAFDITIAPLVNLWGFGPGKLIDEPPADDEIELFLSGTGYENLHTDCTKPAIKKDMPDLMLDLSAIGKGYAADVVADLLSGLGFDSFLVEVGGELRIEGLNSNGEAWAIGVEAPLPNARKPHTVVHLTGTAMATSGDYRNYFEADGKLYSHTIDTRTGRPVTHSLASVTVVDNDGWRADALATALLVMGPEAGMSFAEREGMAVLMLIRTSDGIEEIESAAFAKLRSVT